MLDGSSFEFARSVSHALHLRKLEPCWCGRWCKLHPATPFGSDSSEALSHAFARSTWHMDMLGF